MLNGLNDYAIIVEYESLNNIHIIFDPSSYINPRI